MTKIRDRKKENRLENEKMSWQRMRFKKNKVWLATDAKGNPIEQKGKVLIKYQLEQEHEYWVNKSGVKPIGLTPTGLSGPKEDEALDETVCRDAICIFADGASAGNPGPSGIGIVLRFGKHEKEISKYIGMATNNIAELKAIHTGLLELKNRDLPVRIFTDSNYAYGVLALDWKARKNTNFIKSIKNTMSKFKDLKLIKIKGHAGYAGNERADFLATAAIKNAKSKK